MLFKQTISTQPFKQWLQEDLENRILLGLAFTAIIIQFLIFKFFYPYPNFMPPDSYSYLDAAYQHQVINMWAIGYSWFLRLLSSLTNSHVALAWLQYLLLEVSLLYFLFSIRYLLSPGKLLFRILLACSVLNPLLPHISNFVSSDGLFTALSLVWFTQLLWILFKPQWQLLIFHAVILLFAFMVRYNALYYPLISIIIILFSLHWRTNITRMMTISLIVLLLSLFIGSTQYAYYKVTGTVQFSAFGGWQMAANALYGYAHAVPDSPASVPYQFRELHSLVNQHMKSLRPLPEFLRADHDVGVYYLWNFNSPLRVYMDERWKKDSTTPFFKRWASMAPLYSAYGRYLIEHHSGAFFQYYAWPNFLKYYAPPTGFLGYYNLGRDSVDKIAVTWFGLKNNKVHSHFKDKKIEITEAFTIGLAVINLVFVLSFLSFVALDGFKKCSSYSKQILWWIFVIWFSNMIFSVLAAPIELRYQLFPMTITFTFLGMLLEFLVRESRSVKTTPETYADYLNNQMG